MGKVRIDGKCIFLGCENGRGPLGVGWSILYSRKGLELRLSAHRVAPPNNKKPASRRFGLPGGWLCWSEVGSGGGRKCINLHRTSHNQSYPLRLPNIEKKLQVYPQNSLSLKYCALTSAPRGKRWREREREREREVRN